MPLLDMEDEMRNRSLKLFINEKNIVLRTSDSAAQAAAAMLAAGVGCVILADHDGHLSGIVTDRDLACRLASPDFDRQTKLGTISSGELYFLTPEQSIDDAVSLMMEKEVRRLPILEGQRGGRQRCVGLVTVDDLLAGRLASPRKLSQIVRAQNDRLAFRHGRRPRGIWAAGAALFWPY